MKKKKKKVIKKNKLDSLSPEELEEFHNENDEVLYKIMEEQLNSFDKNTYEDYETVEETEIYTVKEKNEDGEKKDVIKSRIKNKKIKVNKKERFYEECIYYYELYSKLVSEKMKIKLYELCEDVIEKEHEIKMRKKDDDE